MMDKDKEEVHRCCFYVAYKKRYCRMLAKLENKYCGQHMVADSGFKEERLRRIPCPLDPKHSCVQSKLEYHILHCNARPRTDCPYRSPNINVGEQVDEPQQRTLSDLSDEQLLEFISRVHNKHKALIGEIRREVLSHRIVEEAMSTPGYGISVIRHLAQNSSIVGHLQRLGALDDVDSKCFIEFGAGKGSLTKWLIEALDEEQKKPVYVLVDRAAQRYKCDAKLKYKTDLKINRLRIDIQDLDLNKMDFISSSKDTVAFGKHLCGSAVDLALRCLSAKPGKVSTIVIALCCHHRCTWQTYTGRQFLMDEGFKADEFSILLALSSWAVCGARDPVETLTKAADEFGSSSEAFHFQEMSGEGTVEHVHLNEARVGSDSELMHETFPQHTENEEVTHRANRYCHLGLSALDRETVGRKAKQLLDFGRKKFLESKLFSVRLVEYVDRGMTLENVALTALPCQ